MTEAPLVERAATPQEVEAVEPNHLPTVEAAVAPAPEAPLNRIMDRRLCIQRQIILVSALLFFEVTNRILCTGHIIAYESLQLPD